MYVYVIYHIILNSIVHVLHVVQVVHVCHVFHDVLRWHVDVFHGGAPPRHGAGGAAQQLPERLERWCFPELLGGLRRSSKVFGTIQVIINHMSLL